MNFAKYLESQGIKQVEASKALGLSTSYINRLYDGSAIPSLKVARRIVLWSNHSISWESFSERCGK